MAIVAADLKFLGSASRPTDDTSTTGGAIDRDCKIEFTQMASSGTLEVLSSNAGDTTQDITVIGLDATGTQLSDTVTLNGTTPVAVVGTFERVHSATLSADAAGTVTVRKSSGGATVGTIPAGLRVFTILFTNIAADPLATKTFYEKVFVANDHATLTLTEAKIKLSADPSTKIEIGLATAVDDTGTVANRLTAPGSVSFSDDNVELTVPGGGTLAAGSRIGVWIKCTLSAAQSALKTTFDLNITGKTPA